ncbi:molybdenum cofactor biosynthesis protein MoaE [Methylobacterium sp. WL116]|jgi:molybdopterin synthase catalytic subunit|uniref:molybdenum cofactor biosynthesis protein MoaE n=1 Tax=Methylobacterium sp. WL116 TaxID=2603889 RepID=UPI0011CB133E|nr:molybdenum cofactor biosynthesis protein MoaE [Methylobacterium sp. WL116]TXM88505.1 molybdenum cofactor biosynthesis protein MoaE [Methylobacterium sp. WL116]
MPAASLPSVSIQAEPFDVAAEIDALNAQLAGRAGAVVTFTGLCRNEGGRLTALELEHYPGMAEAEIGRVAAAAEARWPLQAVRVIHRYGRVAPGAGIVLVLTASSHRVAAFEAASFLMDYLKTRAPFWKREHLVDGTTGGWVEAAEADDAAAARWAAILGAEAAPEG